MSEPKRKSADKASQIVSHRLKKCPWGRQREMPHWTRRTEWTTQIKHVADSQAKILSIALKHSSEYVRLVGLAALEGRRDLKLLESLMEFLEDPRGHICREAIRILGELGDSRVVEPLLMKLYNGSDFLKHAIMEALVKIDKPAVVSSLVYSLAIQHELIPENRLEDLFSLLIRCSPTKIQLRPLKSLLLTLVLTDTKLGSLAKKLLLT